MLAIIRVFAFWFGVLLMVLVLVPSSLSSETVLIYPSFLKDILTGCRIPVDSSFLFLSFFLSFFFSTLSSEPCG